jgi:hypothetical protein
VWKTELPPTVPPSPAPTTNNQGQVMHRRPLIVFPK